MSEPIICDENADRETLFQRITQLESYLEKTADGKLVCETEKFYCPHCGNEVRAEFDLCYCDECKNEDGGHWPYQPPLPLSYGLCLAVPIPQSEIRNPR